jgi:hypothetical protein
MLPSPFCRRVGIRVSTFEACSCFTRVTAVGLLNRPGGFRHEAQARPVAPFQTVGSYQSFVEPSSTGDPRLRGQAEIMNFACENGLSNFNRLVGTEHTGKYPRPFAANGSYPP